MPCRQHWHYLQYSDANGALQANINNNNVVSGFNSATINKCASAPPVALRPILAVQWDPLGHKMLVFVGTQSLIGI